MSFAHDKRNQKSNLSRIEFLNSAEVKKFMVSRTQCLDSCSNCLKCLLYTHSHSSPHSLLQSARMEIMLRMTDSLRQGAIVVTNDILYAIFECGNFCYCCLQYSSSWAEKAVLAAIFGPGKATLEEDYTGIRN